MEINKEPNLIEKAKSLGTAAVNFAIKDGLKPVSDEVFKKRKGICDACPNWDKSGYAVLGKCKLCGCSVGKLYAPHSKCPDNPPRWLSVSS